MFDRIAPVYDLMNRLMTAGLDGRWRRRAAAQVVWPGDRVLDAAADGRPRARGGAAAAASSASTSPSACSSGHGASRARSSGCREMRSRCRSQTASSTRRPSASASATSRTSRRGCASFDACSALWEGRCSRSRVLAGPAPVLPPLVRRPRPVRGEGAARQGVHVPAGERASPFEPEDLSALLERAGFGDVLRPARRRKRRAAHGARL